MREAIERCIAGALDEILKLLLFCSFDDVQGQYEAVFIICTRARNRFSLRPPKAESDFQGKNSVISLFGPTAN